VTEIATDLERGWRLAEARGVVEPGTVSADPLSLLVDGQPIMIGVDDAGTRHLLIPLMQGHDDTALLDAGGSAISIRPRALLVREHQQKFVDLACLRPDLFDEFAILCADVIEAVIGAPDEPLHAAAGVLKEWRELLRSISAPRLDRGGVIGLFAELRVLDRLLDADRRHSLDAWTGPSRARHDFQRGDVVVEVKGSTARRGRPLTVHGIDQLEPPPNARLYLAWVALEVSVGRGESLRALTERLLTKTLDPATLEQILSRCGYDFQHPESYDTPCFTELELRWYAVDDQFPRLTRANLVGRELPHGVIAVTYELDLGGDSPPILDPPHVDSLIRILAEGAA